MSTMIEVSEETFRTVERLSEVMHLSSADLVGKAVSAYQAGQAIIGRKADDAAFEAGFGLWKERGEDGLAYQERMRTEWDRE